MSGVSKITIYESAEMLKILLSRQKSPEHFQKIQVLYLLKTKQVETITQVARVVGKNRVTVQGWLRVYQEGGLEAMLSERRSQGRKSAISEELVEILREKLSQSPTFTSYQQIQAWLETDFGIVVSYDTVHYLVHDKLKVRLKRKKTYSKSKSFASM
jgi:transposase